MANYTRQTLANKIDYEGGVGEALLYFGREVPIDHKRLQELWRIAYDAIEEIKEILPEPYDGDDDDDD